MDKTLKHYNKSEPDNLGCGSVSEKTGSSEGHLELGTIDKRTR